MEGLHEARVVLESLCTVCKLVLDLTLVACVFSMIYRLVLTDERFNLASYRTLPRVLAMHLSARLQLLHSTCCELTTLRHTPSCAMTDIHI